MDDVPRNLPALLYAHKIQTRAATVGFDWESTEGAFPKISEELAELSVAIAAGPNSPGSSANAVRDELGDLLFAVVNVARHLKVDPETALREATAKFRRRFQAVEALAAGRGIDVSGLDLVALDVLWQEVKAAE
jgi:MazG family protein